MSNGNEGGPENGGHADEKILDFAKLKQRILEANPDAQELLLPLADLAGVRERAQSSFKELDEALLTLLPLLAQSDTYAQGIRAHAPNIANMMMSSKELFSQSKVGSSLKDQWDILHSNVQRIGMELLEILAPEDVSLAAEDGTIVFLAERLRQKKIENDVTNTLGKLAETLDVLDGSFTYIERVTKVLNILIIPEVREIAVHVEGDFSKISQASARRYAYIEEAYVNATQVLEDARAVDTLTERLDMFERYAAGIVSEYLILKHDYDSFVRRTTPPTA